MEIWVAGIKISDKEAELSESDYVPETSASSSSGSAVTAAPALIAVTVQENGNQNLGSATISEPVSKISEQNKKYVVSEGAWNLAADGSWTLKDATGNVMANRWALVPDSLGTAAIGNASWFYLGADGKMLTGWQQITGEDGVTRWYYFNTQLGSLFGACVRNGKTPDGYKVDENGAWVTE